MIYRWLILFVFFLSMPLAHPVRAADWYVSVSGVGAKNGTVGNAWDGLNNVVWGEAGAKAGDTLWVIGNHVKELASYSSTAARLDQSFGSADGGYITVRGDCPGEARGIIHTGQIQTYAAWSATGDGVTWNYTDTYQPFETGSDMFAFEFSDIPNNTFTVLTKKNSLVDCQGTDGSFYFDTDIEKLYVNPVSNADPSPVAGTSGISFGSLGWRFKNWVGDLYLKLYRIGIYNTTRFSHEDERIPSYLWVENCTILYGTLGTFNYGCANNKFLSNEIGWMPNGVYLAVTGVGDDSLDVPHDWLVKGNYIHDMGYLPVTYNTDAHAVAFQNMATKGPAYNIVFDGNYMLRCGTATGFYTGIGAYYQDSKIVNNMIIDCHELGEVGEEANGHGLVLMTDINNTTESSNVLVSGNIVVNSVIGIRDTWTGPNGVKISNNLCTGNGTNYYFGNTKEYPDGNSYAAYVVFKDNMSISPTNYHIEDTTPASSLKDYDSDYNQYWDGPGGDEFKVHGVASTFLEWQTAWSSDANSVTTDPGLDANYRPTNWIAGEDLGAGHTMLFLNSSWPYSVLVGNPDIFGGWFIGPWLNFTPTFSGVSF